MKNLGLWTPYINLPEMFSWYELPARQQRELDRYRPNGHEMDALSSPGYADLRRQTVRFVDASVAPFSPAYHHAGHFRKVEAFGLAAADAYAAAHDLALPRLVRQALGLALYAHDAHHCASTFRTQAPRGVYRPKLGVKVSSEWVTAASLDGRMRRAGLNLPTRLFQTGVIWSSTYGGHTPLGKQLGLPTPEPATVWGGIMRAADVCPAKDFKTFIVQSCAVNYGEIPATPPARTLDGFLSDSMHFAGYIEQCFDGLDTLAKATITRNLGWQRRLTTLRRYLDKLAAGDRQLHAILRKEASRYGVTLT